MRATTHLQLRVLLELEDHRSEHVTLFVMRVPVCNNVSFVRVREGKGFGRSWGSQDEGANGKIVRELARLVIVL